MARIFKPAKVKHSPKTVELMIDELDSHGVGVSRIKPVTFVTGALPGERCQVIITKQQKSVRKAELKQVLSASVLRRTPNCPQAQVCNGCQLQHMNENDGFTLKQQAIDGLLQRATGIGQLPWQAPITDIATGYRRKARLAIDTRGKGLARVGFRDQDNGVFKLEQCENLAPALQRLIKPVQALVNTMTTVTALGHALLLDVQPSITLVFRITQPLSAADLIHCQGFEQQYNCRVLLDSGKDEVASVTDKITQSEYSLLGVTLRFSVNDFIQVNEAVNQRMVAQGLDWLSLNEQDHVLDLFCGIGNFSLPMATRCAHVIGVEGVASMTAKATSNADLNRLTNTRFVHADLNQPQSLAEILSSYPHAISKALVDPARAGALEVMQQLVDARLRAILYVSCNPLTFARDSKVLLAQGYRLSKISAINMFPQTAHTELMALFERD